MGVVALLVLLAFWAAAWLAVPPIAKSQIQKIASEKLGREVTVGKIDFKPWTLELTLNDLRIATADGSAAAAGDRAHLCRRRTAVDRAPGAGDRRAVAIESPAIQLTRLADGKYDIDDILAKLASAPDAPDRANGRAAALRDLQHRDHARVGRFRRPGQSSASTSCATSRSRCRS